MARPLSDEELQLRKRARRRLIGAIALVTAVAVVLPMVLDSEPRPVSQDVDIKIPATDSGGFTSKVAPAPQLKPAPQLETAPAGVKPSGTMAAPTEPAAAAAKNESVVSTAKMPAAKPAAPAEPAPAVKSTAKAVAAKEPAAKTAKASNGHFVVQVAALSDAEKAKQMRQQISAAGIKSYTEVVKTVKGDVTRVRAGPFATREAAEKVQKQLKAIGLDGKVAPK